MARVKEVVMDKFLVAMVLDLVEGLRWRIMVGGGGYD